MASQLPRGPRNLHIKTLKVVEGIMATTQIDSETLIEKVQSSLQPSLDSTAQDIKDEIKAEYSNYTIMFK